MINHGPPLGSLNEYLSIKVKLRTFVKRPLVWVFQCKNSIKGF